jgi:hypothetical protein
MDPVELRRNGTSIARVPLPMIPGVILRVRP